MCKKSQDLYKARDIFMHIAHFNIFLISMHNDACRSPPFWVTIGFSKTFYLTKIFNQNTHNTIQLHGCVSFYI